MLAMATMYFYLAISVRLCFVFAWNRRKELDLHRSVRSMFRAGVCFGLGLSFEISTKIDDERSG